ncbi:hypothetical protein BED35_07065 [Yersinia enterocolitica]|uniref:hypothetical protein n=1 Tax=Yersinia enterocolitica TaxID=630 RepID=UPI0005DC1AE1|nr:hypothetical protein [Yersinia enterocolitica]AOF14008.1 hypothetical protein BB936_05475 [Yersinia enterocolitica]AOF18332.1 hypothetical protein BED34_06615 [Yersinia enterocolitica]AOF22863.1 hypothetical protein BED33_09275 [Yersinia enterocolitica]AOF26573.1 hypothetical protein BED32_06590 [Yersinia enterocolitica]AOF30687.1 hypothetical protein BED35_07065 [Yersinia enterocolitica]
MNEKPILFNADMVNAILSGRKTQTRRIMKVQPQVTERRLRELGAWQDGFNLSQQVNAAFQAGFIDVSCPLGKSGDQLWVRETFALLGNEDGVCVDWQDNMVKGDEQAAARIYKASCEQKHGDYGLYSIPDSAYWKPDTTNMKYEGTWRPSIHMPRWASRINLLITGVRVERLNDISDVDARAEGCAYGKGNGEIDLAVRPENHFPTLWASIYGEESWQANPWVWVINFERMEAK